MPRLRFSIVICNHNYGEFLGDAVRSCLEQRYPAEGREVIVVDDGSADDSRARLAEFAGTGQLTTVEQPNAGQAAAFAAGVARARGELVCLLDSDDWFALDKLARIDAHLRSLGDPGESLMLLHDYETFDQQGGCVLQASWFESLSSRPGAGAALANPGDPVLMPIPCGQVYSRELIQRVCESLPCADWRQGADVTIAHGAFLVARRLHYLREVLATYRVHGRNSMGGIAQGQVIAKKSTRALWPKRAWFLEKLLDTLDDGDEARRERQAYVKRLERSVRTTSAARRLPEPLVSFVVDATAGAGGEATLRALAAQSHRALDIVVVDRPSAPAPDTAFGARLVAVHPDAGRLERLARGFAAARGDFISFLDADDRPDPMFTERHLAALQYDEPKMVSFSELRVLGAGGAVQHASPLSASAVWTAPVRRAGPFDTHMAQLQLPPLATAMTRRSSLLGLLLARGAGAAGRALGERALWLVPRYLDALGGRIEIAECLLSRPVDDPVRALWANRSIVPDARGRPVARPDLSDVALLLLDVYCSEIERFRAVYDERWRARFVTWLAFGHPSATMDRLRELARAKADQDTVDLLDAVQELTRQHSGQVSVDTGR